MTANREITAGDFENAFSFELAQRLTGGESMTIDLVRLLHESRR